MPDLSGGRDGKFAITFCTAGGGTSTMLVDLNDTPERPSSSESFENQDCPFGIVVSQAVMPSQEATVLAGISAHRVALPQPRNQALPPLPALGPPLGSRAPPSNLG